MFERMLLESVVRSNTDGGAATPLPASTSVDPNPSADADFDMPLDDDLDSIDVGPSADAGSGAGHGGSGEALGVQPVAPAPLSPTAPAQPIPATTVAQPAPQAPAQPGPQPSPQAPAQPAQTGEAGQAAGQPKDFLTQLSESREAMVEALTERFAISEEDAELLQTQPEAVLPRMAANIMFEAISSVHKQIQEFVPSIIERHMKVMKAQMEAENAFYEKWPGLKGLDEEKSTRLNGIIKAYNAANPNQPRERRIEEIGALAHQIMGIPLPVAAAPPKRPKAAPPFQPANGGLPGTAQTAVDDDPWAGFDLPNSG